MTTWTMLKIGDTVECAGNHDTYNSVLHLPVPFQFKVVDMTAYGNPVDEAGFVHPANQCTLVIPNG